VDGFLFLGAALSSSLHPSSRYPLYLPTGGCRYYRGYFGRFLYLTGEIPLPGKENSPCKKGFLFLKINGLISDRGARHPLPP
jgi:hypothetical protein